MDIKIDPTRTWRKVEERLARESNPRVRRNLETVLAHMKAEACGDLEGLMATVAAQAHYHAYGSDDPFMSPRGRDAVRSFYEGVIASGATTLQLDIDRLVADEDCVLTEGLMRMAYPGRVLALMGKSVDDPDAHYLYETRMAILWPMDAEAKVLGEDSYTGRDGFEGIEQRKLSPAEIREYTEAA